MWTHGFESLVSEVLKAKRSFEKLAATRPIKQNRIPHSLSLLRSIDEVITITIISSSSQNVHSAVLMPVHQI